MDSQNDGTNPTSEKNTTKHDTNLFLGICAYLGPLVIISYFLGKNNSFVKFHMKQGLVLLIIEIIIWILGNIFWPFWFILQLVNLMTLILSIFGIVNVLQNKEKGLPIVGHLSKHFKF